MAEDTSERVARRFAALPAWARWLLVAVAVCVAASAWLGARDLVGYVVRALPLGSIFALMAVGIVVTYKTSGVLNLAYAAQAFVSALVFYDLRSRHEWAVLPAVVVAVLVVAPALGLVLERFLFRHLRSASQLARLVTSLGLLVAIPQLVRIWFGPGGPLNPPSIGDLDRFYRLGRYTTDVDGVSSENYLVNIDQHQLVTIVTAAVLVLALSAMFRWSRLGLHMRAVVESPRLTQLQGVDADRVSAVSWAMSSVFAGLAGVLLAPFFSQPSENDFFMLLVAALAAAVFGRLASVPLTFLGAILLAVLMGVVGGELPEGNTLAANIRPALPFLVLIALLVLWPGLSRRRDLGDPLSGVDPPPPVPAALVRSRTLTVVTWALGVATAAAAIGLALTSLDDFWLGRLTVAVILGVIFLSVTVVTGMGGMLSLCQATFAAVGAFATAQLVNSAGFDVLTAIFVGAVIAGVAGTAVAVPALRLSGIYLSLVTLAFAIFFETVVARWSWVSGGSQILRVPRPLIGPIDFGDDQAYLFLCMVLLAVVAVTVGLLKRGTTGRFLDAIRGSETAAVSIGINPARSKLIAFGVSAGIAGFGGGLLVTQGGNISPANFQADYAFIKGLVWVVLVVTLGSRSVQAAIIGGAAFVLMPELFIWLEMNIAWATVLFGLGALTYARNPDGIIEANTRRFITLFAREPAT